MPDHGGDTPFAAALRAALQAAGLSQRQVADELRIDASSVSRWTNGRVIPHRETVRKLQELLDVELESAFAVTAPVYELFVSAPITGLEEDALNEHHDAVAKAVESLRGHVNSLYWPGENIRTADDLQAPDIATEENMEALAQCSAFVFLQFGEVVRPSSALIELGCALGLKIRTTVLIRAGVQRPFMLTGFQGVAERVGFLPNARIYDVRDVRHCCDLIEKTGRKLLGLE